MRNTERERDYVLKGEEDEENIEGKNDGLLSVYSAAALLTADCMGTGILALPGNMNILSFWGYLFLLLNLPINYYAGSLLSQVALSIEQHSQQRTSAADDDSIELPRTSKNNSTYQSVNQDHLHDEIDHDSQNCFKKENPKNDAVSQVGIVEESKRNNDDENTKDLIGIARVVYDSSPWKIRIVAVVYYTNIFLVLGDYILVMSHAVVSMVGNRICIPTAGLIASTLMFSLSQIRTMSHLGHGVTWTSLSALCGVLLLCLSHEANEATNLMNSNDTEVGIFRSLSALSSIGFAVGSQKLLLNIRHDMHKKEEAPRTLSYALTGFGTVYIFTCLLAGSHAPSFLIDFIPTDSWASHLTGFLLWVHVAVSYAINSQALCSNLLPSANHFKWAALTLLVSTSSYFVSNAIPFFQDLVAIIGALTSVPLTLLLPALYYRDYTKNYTNVGCILLVVYSVVFLICGVIGSIASIGLDWEDDGKTFFSCT